jgi:hypothetical protein
MTGRHKDTAVCHTAYYMRSLKTFKFAVVTAIVKDGVSISLEPFTNSSRPSTPLHIQPPSPPPFSRPPNYHHRTLPRTSPASAARIRHTHPHILIFFACTVATRAQMHDMSSPGTEGGVGRVSILATQTGPLCPFPLARS